LINNKKIKYFQDIFTEKMDTSALKILGDKREKLKKMN